ncbi:MAG TPA: TonB-dependent receptor [Novosphingobium sp.]|nr:TonB-dependent receptor [Novosphingobium sp.]
MKAYKNIQRIALVSCSALVAIGAGPQAHAQDSEESVGVRDIIVTAQKREQSLQDVPIAITAVTQDTLQSNRITNVTDLTSIAPNLTVLSAYGGSGIPAFGMRGLVSLGSVSGQDKSVSLYLDGVSIASPVASTFDLPDLERIEVLRGPQGTLFGRNSTGGAISVITRDPSGDFSLRQQLTYGNFSQFRSVTRVELPQIGPFSASVSYTHDERNGDVKNLAAGFVWDRTAVGLGKAVSPKRFGDQNKESVFVAVKFEPSDAFNTSYKFDWAESRFTPEGSVLAVFNPEAIAQSNPLLLSPQFAGLLRAYFLANPAPIAGGKRPKTASAPWTIPGFQRVQGHNLTSNLIVSDSLSLKSILAHRKSYVFSAADLTGLSGFKDLFGAFGPVGAQFVPLGFQVEGGAKQWSAELQANYESDFLTLTAGGIYFRFKGEEGAPVGLRRVPVFASFPNGVIGVSPLDRNTLKTESWAGFVQAEVHVTPEIDVIGGFRITNDKKDGTNYVVANGVGLAFPFTYDDTKSNYSIGANYRPTQDMMVYAKYSTGFVAGGVTSTIAFAPETVKSWEAGLKADLFDRRVRFNLAVFKSDYKNLQAVSGGASLPVPRPELGTIVVTQGNLDTKGVEAEIVVAPIDGLTLNGSVGYTDYKLTNLNPILGTLPFYRLSYRARWTGALSAQYESQPFSGEMTFFARIDGNYRSPLPLFSQLPTNPIFEDLAVSPAGWLLNGRVALRHIKFGGGKAEVALWGKNLTDQDRPLFPVSYEFLGAAVGSYEPARTYGVDLTFEF